MATWYPLSPSHSFNYDDHRIAILPASIGALISLSYIVLHPDPAIPGLYFQMAAAVQANNYILPQLIPHYTSGGLPFAYPPLSFYLLAAVQDLTGISFKTSALGLALVYNVGWAVTGYWFAYELFQSRRQAAVAGILMSSTPAIFYTHLGAYGAVRSLAFLTMIAGFAAGVRIFKNQDKRWIAVGACFFALTILSHPLYAFWFGVTYLVMFAAFSRTANGLIAGCGVAVGGLALTAPWWGWVAVQHGPHVFVGAMGTHGGVAGNGFPVKSLAKIWTLKELKFAPLTLWYLMPLGVAYLVAQKRFFLPIWLAIVALGAWRHRITVLIEALIATPLLVNGLIPAIERVATSRSYGRRIGELTLAGILIAGVLSGVLFSSTIAGAVFPGTPVPASSFDGPQEEAAAWMQTETPPDATFVAIAPVGTNEKLPYKSQRTLLVMPWGAEWNGDGAYMEHQTTIHSLRSCGGVKCVENIFAKKGISPDHLYLDKGSIEVASFRASDQYRAAFENSEVAIFRRQQTT